MVSKRSPVAMAGAAKCSACSESEHEEQTHDQNRRSICENCLSKGLLEACQQSVPGLGNRNRIEECKVDYGAGRARKGLPGFPRAVFGDPSPKNAEDFALFLPAKDSTALIRSKNVRIKKRVHFACLSPATEGFRRPLKSPGPPLRHIQDDSDEDMLRHSQEALKDVRTLHIQDESKENVAPARQERCKNRVRFLVSPNLETRAEAPAHPRRFMKHMVFQIRSNRYGLLDDNSSRNRLVLLGSKQGTPRREENLKTAGVESRSRAPKSPNGLVGSMQKLGIGSSKPGPGKIKLSSSFSSAGMAANPVVPLWKRRHLHRPKALQLHLRTNHHASLILS